MVEIIYQDEHSIIANKPAGMLVHPDMYHPTGTLIQELVEQFPEIKSVGEDALRPGIVHRLDKDTSGVLLVARNQKAFEYFKKQFQERRVTKEYYVLVAGNIREKKGSIDLPIGRAKHNPTKRVALGEMRGTIRQAQTEYEAIEHFGNDFTFLKAFPKTGRTHQIRAHCKAIHHPVVCDALYSGKRFKCPFGLSHHFLHAFALELKLLSGSMARFEADMPEDLERVLERLREEKESGRIVKS